LLALLGLLDVPTSGEMSLLGETLGRSDTGLRRRLRAQHLGFVFQSFHLMAHRTVLENTMLGGLYRGMSRGARRIEALDALDRVGLSPKAARRASTLSGGERQRAAIARALVGSPRILLCDEPTGNLDTSNSRAVIKLLQELSAGGITLVMVTHEPTIAALGTQQLQVVDGVVSEVVSVA
jgi:putative ABC transport system ATP-binding protein